MLSVTEYQANLTDVQKAFIKKYDNTNSNNDNLKLKKNIVRFDILNANSKLLKSIRMDNECFYYIQLAIKNNLQILDTKVFEDSNVNHHLTIFIIRRVGLNEYIEKSVCFRISKQDNEYILSGIGTKSNETEYSSNIDDLITCLFDNLCYDLLNKTELKKVKLPNFVVLNG